MAARAMRNGPLELTLSVCSHSSGGSSQKPLVRWLGTPALLMRTCSPPSPAMVSLTARCASSQLLTLPTMGMAQPSPPISRASFTLRSNCPSSMSISAACAPAPTRASAISRPMPIELPAPVMSATLPSRGCSAMRVLLRRRVSGARVSRSGFSAGALGDYPTDT